MADWLNIAGKTVIVTGGSSGIGKSIVESLLEQKVNVANFDLTDSELDDERLLFVKADVTSQEEVAAGVTKVMNHFGTIDGLVNNAGINIPRLLVDKNDPHGKYELSEEVFDKIIAVNQKGLFLMSQAVARVLVKKEEGVIINMSSESGLEGSEGQSPYAATKAAVNSYTRSWAKELGKSNVRIVGIAPGIMEETGLRTLAYEEALAYTSIVVKSQDKK
ncbi:SDR family oxidoreductase [Tetragenococcus halophilus]|nr:SDR family oxidoreductase [Tetragenococcus halophilus]